MFGGSYKTANETPENCEWVPTTVSPVTDQGSSNYVSSQCHCQVQKLNGGAAVVAIAGACEKRSSSM